MKYIKIYADFLKKLIKPKQPLKAVFDCSNGTTGIVLKELLRASSVKCQVSGILINEKPDGRFPAHGPNPMAEGAMDQLSKEVKKKKADLGVIFDADGDRAFFVDDLGRPIYSGVAALFMSQSFKGPIILDLVIGYAGELISQSGQKVIESRIGSYFIKKLMKEKKAKFGAESSGHFYFPVDGTYFDSGIMAVIYMINRASSIKRQASSLSDWIDSLPEYYRSPELNFEVKDKTKFLKIMEEKYSKQAKNISHLDGVKMEFENWWFNLRPSNTEDLLRLNLEAKNESVYQQKLSELETLLKKC